MDKRILTNRSGIMRREHLHERGLSNFILRKEIAAGNLVAIGRGWIALPQADPQLMHAAATGLTISCITQAARLGLWVRDATGCAHFAVQRKGAEQKPQTAVLHYAKPLVPRERFTLADSIENALALVAQCEPFEDAVATWDSALNKKLVDRQTLETLKLPPAARRVLAATDPFADSGLETYFRVRLRWLKVPLRSQVWLAGHRVDFLIGKRLVIQVDGAHHTGQQRTSDIEHDAQLRLRGFTVIRVSYAHIMHSWPDTQELIMHAIAHGLHEPALLR